MIIANVKRILLPFVDFDFTLLYTEIGQDNPKHINITLSNTVTIKFASLLLVDTIIRLTFYKVKYIIIIKTITFRYGI